MRILQIHKYYSKKKGGGSVSAFFETKKLLEKKGHDIMVFSMHNDDNEYAKESKFFANQFDIRHAKNIFQKIFLVPRVIYNRDAIKKLDELLKIKKPDIAHIHNIYHYLTPGIFKVLKKHKVPIVFKLSDYHAICPNYKLFAHGKIDNSCRGKKYYKLFLNKSINNSYSESFVAMIEGYVNKWCKFYDYVDIFTAPSEFMKDLCVGYDIPIDKIKILRNVINFDEYLEINDRKNKTFLFMGRLSEEKGLIVAIDAMEKLKKENKLNGWKFIIAGQGPQEDFLREYIKDKKLIDIIKFVGFCEKGSDKWLQIMNTASVALLPSIWYDNSPIAISESMVFNTPVIVSDLGGTKEMVDNGKTGFVFKSNDVNDLISKMKVFIDDESKVKIMGHNARFFVEKLNNEEKYYNNLIEIYNNLIDEKEKTIEK